MSNIRTIHAGINEYNRWRHLLIAEAEGEPSIVDPEEVMWVGYIHPEELREMHIFEDFELARTFSKE